MILNIYININICHFRFVFHENWGIKLQDSVMFPVDGLVLDLEQEIVYDLYACVCHTGSMLFKIYDVVFGINIYFSNIRHFHGSLYNIY